MLLFLGILLGVCSIAIVVAGLLGLLRNPEKSQNRWFFALTVAVGLWTVFNFIDSNIASPWLTGFAVKLDFCGAVFMAWCLLKFVTVFINENNQAPSKITRIITSRAFWNMTLILNLVICAAVFSNQVVSVSIVPELSLTTQPVYYVYTFVIISYIVLALGDLLASYLRGNKNDRQKISFIALGFSAAAIANILSNLVFPAIFSQRSTVVVLNTVGYLGIFLLVLFMYLAITTRKLFDIRLVLARSLTYVLLFGALAMIYLVVLTAASFAFVDKAGLSPRNIIVSFLATVFAVLTFPLLRGFFNKLTTKMFFRDNYEIQDIVNSLTAVTTSTLSVEKLSDGASAIFKDSLKSSWCGFVVYQGDEMRKVGAAKMNIDVVALSKTLRGQLKPHRVIDSQNLEKDKLKRVLDAETIEIVVPMHANQTLVGYMLLGTKQTGAAYNQKDIRFLNISADTLSVAIQNALRFEEIQSFAATLQEKVDDATRKLRKTNEKLRQLDETKDDFISMASHQLRTPLTSVKGYVSMVLDGDAGKVTKQQEKLLDQAFVSSQRMVYLIADLLNVSRLKTGKFVIEPKPTNLADVVESEMEQLKETAKGRGLKLEYVRPKNFPALNLDETKVRQVIMNFSDNAIYYTPAGGTISVNLTDKPESVELTVVDNGIGVPKSEQHHLFTKFYRAGNAKKARPDGTGLGLFMAQKVIIAQGGAIIFHSEENKGSTFGFSFPKAKLLVK